MAYRTRNEFLLYVVNNLPYCKDENGKDLEQGYVVARALDEITSMKVLSRIEGDDTKISDKLLDNLSKAIEDGLKTISGEDNTVKSISLAKLKEMKAKLVSGYTSFGAKRNTDGTVDHRTQRFHDDCRMHEVRRHLEQG